MNFITYFFTFQLVYICYASIIFVPILFLGFLSRLLPSELLFIPAMIVGIISMPVIFIPLLVLIFWFSHQTTKRIAYWHLSWGESFRDTFKTFKSYIGIIFHFK